MGQTLSEPVVAKHTNSGEDDTLAYAISEMQGWRISMEDAHATVLNLDERTGDEKASFFAVYDGHGGSTVAQFSGKTVHSRLAKLEEYKSGKYEQALKRAFLATDEDLRSNPDYANDPSGCTAVAALLVAGPAPPDASKEKVARRIIVANAGDSRSVLSYKGEAKPMSYDHKPGNKEENTRIVSAGGFVEFGRVNGNLALSRAIGDFEFKQNFSLSAEAQIVTADPEIISHDIDGEEEFLVLACDGIWDCLSSQQVIDFVRRGIHDGKTLEQISEETMDRCLAPDSEIGGVGCDNMTMCVVALLGGRSKQEWYDWVKSRVEQKIGWDTPQEIAPVFNSQPNRAGGGGGGGGGVLSALAGAGGFGTDENDENSGGNNSLKLPSGLAQALSGAGIVFRPSGDGSRDQDGDMVYEAHVVDSDESDDEGNNESESKVSEIKSEDASSSTKERPDLKHQPEIVESPDKMASSSNPPPTSQSTEPAKVEVRESTEGSGAQQQQKE